MGTTTTEGTNICTINTIKLTTKTSMKAGKNDAKDSDQTRENWSLHIDYILSSIGYCVGFGAFWRFPYVCMRNGGGAFLIPYFISLMVCGMPLFFLETVVGQMTGLGPTGVWSLCPIFKGVGWSMVIMSGLVSVYSATVLAWVVHFTVSSFTPTLPWTSCGNQWNTPFCYERGHHGNATFQSLPYNASLFTSPSTPLNHSLFSPTNITYRNSAEEYWEESVLELSPGIEELGGVRWAVFACLLATWVVAFLCLFKGIKWSGKVVYVTATLPYVFLTVILIRSVMLPGALQGIIYYLKPDFEKLKSPKVWAEASLQIFYSLGPTWGGLIAMARYNKFNNNCFKDTMVICLTSPCTSLYAGFICFSVLGYMAQEIGKEVKDVVSTGPGLVFNVYPEALAHMPLAPLWSVCFFLTMFLIGIDSLIGLVETVSSGLTDEFPLFWKSKKLLLTAIICLLLFLLGIPLTTQGGMYVFQILDWYLAAFATTIIALVECVGLVHFYGPSRLYRGMEEMLGRKVSLWWKFCWCYLTPIIMLALFIYICLTFTPPSYGSYHYPSYVIVIGKCLATVSLIPIPVGALIVVLKQEGSILERLKQSTAPRHSRHPFEVKATGDHAGKLIGLLSIDTEDNDDAKCMGDVDNENGGEGVEVGDVVYKNMNFDDDDNGKSSKNDVSNAAADDN